MNVVNIKNLTRINTLTASDMLLVARNASNSLGYTTYNTTLQTLSNAIATDAQAAELQNHIATSWNGISETTTNKGLGANLGYGLKTNITTITNNYLNKTSTGASTIQGTITFSNALNVPTVTVNSSNAGKSVNVGMLTSYVQSNKPNMPAVFSSTNVPKIWRYVFESTSSSKSTPMIASHTDYNKYLSGKSPTQASERFYTGSGTTGEAINNQIKYLVHFFQKPGLVTIQASSAKGVFVFINKANDSRWTLAGFNEYTLKSNLQTYLLDKSNANTGTIPYYIGKVEQKVPLTFNVDANTIIVIADDGAIVTNSAQTTSTPWTYNSFQFGCHNSLGDNGYVTILQWLDTPVSGELYG